MRHPAPSVLWGRGLGDWEGASQKCQGRTRLKPGGVQGGRELSESWACSGRGVFPLEGGSQGVVGMLGLWEDYCPRSHLTTAKSLSRPTALRPFSPPYLVP